MLYDPEIMTAFIEEIAEYLPQLRQHLHRLASQPRDKDALEEAYRLAHTIKGSSAMLELDELSAEGRFIEQTLLPVTEKKAPFTPDMAAVLLERVDKVENLLEMVRVRVNDESAAALEPASLPSLPFAPPPPPPPVQGAGWNWDATELAGSDLNRPGGPLSPVDILPDFGPPPPPPPVLYQGLNLLASEEPWPPTGSAGAMNVPPPPPLPAWFEASLSEENPSQTLPPPFLSSGHSFDFGWPPAEEAEAGSGSGFFENLPPPPPPPPAYLYHNQLPVPASSTPPPPGRPNIPASEAEGVSGPVQPAGFPLNDVDLFEMLLEPSSLESLEEALFGAETTVVPPSMHFPPGQAELADGEGPVLDFDSFEPALPWPAPSPSTGFAAPALDDAAENHLQDILATGTVDQSISQLQDAILSELPPQMGEFNTVPMPSEISVSDAELLQVLDQDVSLAPVAYLPGLDSDNLLEPSGYAPPAPLSGLERYASSDPAANVLDDFTAAEDLLASFDLSDPEEFGNRLTRVINPAYSNPPIDQDAPTFRPFVPHQPALVSGGLPADLPALAPEVEAGEVTVEPLALAPVAGSGPDLPPDPNEPGQEDFAMLEFEALAVSLSQVEQDEEAIELAALNSLRAVPELSRPPVSPAPEPARPLTPGDASTDPRIDPVVAALEQEAAGLDWYSEEELAGAGLAEDNTELGAFFLAEAQADLDQLKELVGRFGQSGNPATRLAEAGRIREICGTLRKAAAMMDLEEIARQVSVLENTAALVGEGELEPSAQSDTLFNSSLAELLDLLKPFETAAANLFAGPDAVSVTPAEPDATIDRPTGEAATLAAESRPVASAAPSSLAVQPVYELDADLAEVFATEAEEHIHNLDTRLAALELDTGNRELLREIRRTAHTLKGSAAMVGFNVVSQTAHLMEDLLDRLYDGTQEVTPEVIELLFVTFNGMDAMVRGLAAGQAEDSTLLEALRPSYAALLNAGPETTEADDFGGGAIIFEPRPGTVPVAVEPPAPVAMRRVEAAEMEALEAALAAEEAPEMEAAIAPGVAALALENLPAPARAVRSQPVAPLSGSLDSDLSVKIPIKNLDVMMNQVGELVINRTVLERRNQILNRNVDELTLSIKRLQRVTRELETRYEVELLRNSAVPVGTGPETARPGGFDNNSRGYEAPAVLDRPDMADFDTLEMDRYTEFHTLSREMTETVDDLAASLRELDGLRHDLENALLQQARLTDDLQDRVVKVRLVPVANLTPRLYRTVRSLASLQQKEIDFVVSGEQTQLDKTIFEELGDPLLHLVRNAIDHGIETPEEREASGKPRVATLAFTARSEGSQVIIEVRDDGRGINLEQVRQSAIRRGLLAPEAPVSEDDLYDMLFIPGFSTSETVTDISGRGVGLDVVRANIARLKGTVEVVSEPGKGTIFFLRLPSTLAITRALLVKVRGYTYAIPLSSIERTVRVEPAAIESYGARSYYRLEEATLPLLDMNRLLQLQPRHHRDESDEEEQAARSPFAVRRERPLLVINGPERAVVQVDSLVGQQEVVVKPLGTHLKAVPGVTGATILGTGEVILILNTYELVAGATGRRNRYSAMNTSRTATAPAGTAVISRSGTGTLRPPAAPAPRARVPLIQVVDDSLSIRKVLSAALEKAGFRVRTSKDGQEAYEMIQQVSPDLIVMDIEMPRMDGYELTAILKGRETFRHIPIVMLTSRAGLKHRQKAEEVGANGFLVKPYREEDLLQTVSTLLMPSRR